MCPAFVKKGFYAEASTPISFTVKPHTTSVVAWDMPSAIVAGERFRMKVGIKCSNECQPCEPGLWNLRPRGGARRRTGTLSGDRWPGTTGLYVAEVELEAPAAEGLYTWSVKAPGSVVGSRTLKPSYSFWSQSRQPSRVPGDGRDDRQSQPDAPQWRSRGHAPIQACHRRAWRGRGRVAKGVRTNFSSRRPAILRSACPSR